MPFDATTLANADFDKLLDWMTNIPDPTKAGELDTVVEYVFRMMDTFTEEQQQKLVVASDRLAELFGLPSAVQNYQAHLVRDNYHQGPAVTSFSFKDSGGNLFHPDLVAKILEDVAQMSHGDIGDIQKEQGGDIVGIEITDSGLRNNLDNALSRIKAFDDARHMSPEQAARKMFWLQDLPESIASTHLEAWKQELGNVVGKVLSAKTPEDMGMAFCEQMFLLPFSVLATWASKFDSWILDRAKQGLTPPPATHGPTSSPTPSPSSGTGGSGTSTPDTGTPTPDGHGPDLSAAQEAIANRLRLAQLTEFKDKYLMALYRPGQDDPKRHAMATQLEAIFNDDNFDWATFQAGNSDLHKAMWEDLAFTMANPKNAALKDVFMNMDILPDALKNDMRKKIKSIGMGLAPDGKIRPTEKDVPDLSQMESVLTGTHAKNQETIQQLLDNDMKAFKNHPMVAALQEIYQNADQTDRKHALERLTNNSVWTPKDLEVVKKFAEAFQKATGKDMPKRDLMLYGPQPKTGDHAHRLDAAARAEQRLHNIIFGGKIESGAHIQRTGTPPHDWGSVIDESNKSITRFHEKDGQISSVTYFPDDGRIILMQPDKHHPDRRSVSSIEFKEETVTAPDGTKNTHRSVWRDGKLVPQKEAQDYIKYMDRAKKQYDKLETEVKVDRLRAQHAKEIAAGKTPTIPDGDDRLNYPNAGFVAQLQKSQQKTTEAEMSVFFGITR